MKPAKGKKDGGLHNACHLGHRYRYTNFAPNHHHRCAIGLIMQLTIALGCTLPLEIMTRSISVRKLYKLLYTYSDYCTCNSETQVHLIHRIELLCIFYKSMKFQLPATKTLKLLLVTKH